MDGELHDSQSRLLMHVSRAFFSSSLDRGANSGGVVIGVVAVVNPRLDMHKVNVQPISLEVLTRKDSRTRMLALYCMFFFTEI